MRNKILPFLLPPLAAILIFGGAFLVSHSHPFLQVRTVDAEYAADFSNDEILMGASHNVFIGKVIRQTGEKERGIGPETQFQVQVIENIKGDLKGTVTVDQEGGYKDGVLYVMDGDIGTTGKNASDYLLQPGSTYLLATRYNPDENWYTLNSYPTARELFSSDSSATNDYLLLRTDADPRVKALKAAYPHEILLPADIAHNNTRNSYQSVQAQPAAK
jgi:hypothetical protein